MRPSRIFLVSNEAWGPVWFSKHHYAHELAKLGHRVSFVDPPAPWRLRNLVSFSVRAREVEPGLEVVSYENNLPAFRLSSALARLNDCLNCAKLRVARGASQGVLFWQFDPARLERISFFPRHTRILHVVDKYEWSTDLRIAKRADLVVVVSPTRRARYEGLARRLMVIPHGVSPEDRAADPERVRLLRARHGRFILFIGTLNHHVDFELLEEIARCVPEATLLIIGPADAGLGVEQRQVMARTCERANVRWLGPIHAKELRDYIQAASLCIIPYRAEGNYRHPLKALHYLSQLKPLVSIRFPDLEAFPGGLVFFADSHDGFVRQCRRILDGDYLPRHAEVDAYLRTIEYPQLIAKILDSLDEKGNAD
jgi:hypothetical protein